MFKNKDTEEQATASLSLLYAWRLRIEGAILLVACGCVWLLYDHKMAIVGIAVGE